MGVGIATALSGVLIEGAVNLFSSVRFGFCKAQPFASRWHCQAQDWVDWGTGFVGFLANIGTGTIFAVVSAALVKNIAPAAAGSGIPEVKTILNGFVMPEVVALRTLLVKVPGLALAVAAGMALGKEGPLVHVAVCWAQVWSGLFPQFQNEVKRRELFSAAAAAGVSTAFGAPLGGVLFSLEEVSSYFPPRTLIRTFTAAVSAALMLSFLKSRSSHGLTLFSVEYNASCHPVENAIFAIIGIAGGLAGAAFNAVNLRWSAFRMRPAFRSRVGPVTEAMVTWLNLAGHPRVVLSSGFQFGCSSKQSGLTPSVTSWAVPEKVALICVLTLLSSWPFVYTRYLSTDIIHAIFASCDQGADRELRSDIGICTPAGGYPPATSSLILGLAGASLIRFLQMTMTFGTQCPAGLFVPSLFIGACFGRSVGVAVRAMNQEHHFFASTVEPGVYAMVGAAAVLGGVCRVTISLVAIMLELTGGMTYIVPFMLAVLIAKIVGDVFTEGIYDLYIVLKGYPYLQEEVNVTFDERCCDIMDTDLMTLDVSLSPRVRDIRLLLREVGFHGFPVVNGGHFIGYAKRHRLEAMLDDLLGRSPPREEEAAVALEDLLPYTDSTVIRMVPDASLAQAHKVFKQLGCKYIFLVGSRGNTSNPTQDVLQGILSKKRFLLSLKSGRVGHMTQPNNFESGSLSRTAASTAARVRILQQRSGSGTEANSFFGGELAPHPGANRRPPGSPDTASPSCSDAEDVVPTDRRQHQEDGGSFRLRCE